MSRIGGNRYVGTRAFDDVRDLLMRAARERRLVSYQEVAALIHVPARGNHMGRECGQVLGEICDFEHGAGRPLLSAVAVNAAGTPGFGFFNKARELGQLEGDSRREEARFLADERERVFVHWRQAKQ